MAARRRKNKEAESAAEDVSEDTGAEVTEETETGSEDGSEAENEESEGGSDESSDESGSDESGSDDSSDSSDEEESKPGAPYKVAPERSLSTLSGIKVAGDPVQLFDLSRNEEEAQKRADELCEKKRLVKN